MAALALEVVDWLCTRLEAEDTEAGVGEATPDIRVAVAAALRELTTLSSVAAAIRLVALCVDAAPRRGAVLRTEVGTSSSSAPRKR